MNLKTLKRGDNLREAWANEACDFTPWLEKHLDQLGEAVGIPLEFVERESRVGRFRLDILARDTATGESVVIENQLEESNHWHLGQLLTYAAGKKANHVIWVMKNSRPEHRAAIEWLNSHSDGNVGFYLVEIQLWKIIGEDGQEEGLAPLLSVLERPNCWSSSVAARGASFLLDFWTDFLEHMKTASYHDKFEAEFPHARSPRGERSHGFGIGLGGVYLKAIIDPDESKIGVALAVGKDKEAGARVVNAIVGDKDNVRKVFPEIVFGDEIALMKNVDLSVEKNRPAQFDWMMETLLKFKAVFGRYAAEAKASAE